MKTMKKTLSLVLAIVMALALAMPAMAEGGHTISLTSTDTHTYRVFQVLTGTLSGDGSKQLGNPAWGADAIANPGDVNEFITSITAAGLTEQQIADLVAAKVDTSGDGRGTVTAAKAIEGLATGYYVLVDVTDVTAEGFKDDTKALHVVKVVNDIEDLSIKWSTTSDEKTITSDTLGKDGSTFADGSTNDNVSIGDTVNYQIKTHVPGNTDKFAEGTFFFVITDKLSTGLTFTPNSIKVYKGSVAQSNLLDADAYTVKYPPNTSDGNTFEIGLKDAGSATYRNQDIIVVYSATLNENAVIGDAGNPNTSTVKFSNNPNEDFDGQPVDDKDYPGFPDSSKNVPTGVTPVSETKTYSTGIEILKVDENGEPLTGVKFQISGDSVKKVVTKTETFVVDNENGTYYKLKNNTYTTVAPTTENTMAKAEAGATKGYVIDPTATGTDAITIGDTIYRPYVPQTDSGKDIYILVEGSKDAYADTNKYRKDVTQKTVDSAPADTKMEEEVDANGLVRFDGLGEGTFTIKETQTPSGYNTVSDITLEVTYDATGTPKFTTTSGDVSYVDGVFQIKVVNKKGTELPETGGIGTKIFYTMGAVLVIGAGVVLVSRKRAGE